jgi:class 3 adenylate cyclase
MMVPDSTGRPTDLDARTDVDWVKRHSGSAKCHSRIAHCVVLATDTDPKYRDNGFYNAAPSGEGGNMELGVLFCDQVGSTDLLTRLGDELADEIRRDLFEALYRAADLCRGEVVKSSGDGLMVVFPAGSDDALQCGELMVRMVARLARRQLWSGVQFKVGVSQGEAIFDKGDWYGAAVNLAARLCAAAQPSQVLAMSAAITGSMTDGPTWEVLPPMSLKGFPEPVEVRAHTTVDADVAAWAVPVEFDLQGSSVLVGRDAALRDLEMAWEQAATGSSALISVIGDPGLGVTRMLGELGNRVVGRTPRPGVVLSARNDVAVPWTSQIVRSLAATADESDLRVDAGNDAPALASICPLVGLRLGIAPAPASGVSDQVLVSRLLARVATRRPVLVVADGFDPDVGAELVRTLPAQGCLVAGGSRASHGIPGSSRTVALNALNAAELAVLIDTVIPRDRPWRGELVDLVVAETNGVPRDVLAVVNELARSGNSAELTGTAALDAVRQAVPYKGLQVFSDDDAVRFFGRERAVDDVLTALSTHEFVVVVGSSGSGKSSVVRAGCLPRLVSEGVDIVVMTPGEEPVRALSAAWSQVVGGDPDDHAEQLRIDPGALARTTIGRDHLACLVVDQLEESFTLCADEEERERFLQIITRPVPGLRVLATLRGDFYGKASEYSQLAWALQNGTVVMTPPSPGELRTVIEAPAAAAHLTLEPGLADLILTDVTDRPGGLPLLSHALSATWRLRHRRMLTIADYREAGGATGAIARTADSVFDQLNPSEQEVAKRIFLRLTALGEGVEDSGRRVPVNVLVASGTPDGLSVLDVLLAARLVTAGTDAEGTHVDELAHEALLREWPRLRAWLDEDRDELRALAHLESASRDWDASGRNESELYAGRRLEAAEEVSPDKLNDLERIYLAASVEHREAEHRKARRATRRLQTMVVVLVVLLVASAIAGITAGVEYGHAKSQQIANVRDNNALIARSLIQDGEKATAAGETDKAVLLDAQAARFAGQSGGLISTAAVQAPLITSLQANPHLVTYLTGLSGAIEDVSVSPDGHYATAVNQAGRVGVWRLSDYRLLTTFMGQVGGLAVAFMGDDTIAVLGQDGVTAYRGSDHLTTWKRKWVQPVQGAVTMVGSRTGIMVTTNDNPTAYLFSPTGHQVNAGLPFSIFGGQIAASPDGSLFAVMNPDASGAFPTPGGAPPASETVIDLYSPNGDLQRELTTSVDGSAVGFSADGSKVGVVVEPLQPAAEDSSTTTATYGPQGLHLINIATGVDTTLPVPVDSTAAWTPIGMSPILDEVAESDGQTAAVGSTPQTRLGLANVLTGSFMANLARIHGHGNLFSVGPGHLEGCSRIGLGHLTRWQPFGQCWDLASDHPPGPVRKNSVRKPQPTGQDGL